MRLILLLPLLMACETESGLNGPAYVVPPASTGPCFEADLSNGLADSDELLLVFDCFNQYGAFEPVHPTLLYVAASDDVQVVIDSANFSMDSFDIGASMETASNLLNAPEAPLSTALDTYVEVYDRGLINRLVRVSQEGARALLRCEDSDNPDSCSLPRLVRRVLDTDIPDRGGRVMDALSENMTDEELHDQILSLNNILYRTSGAQNNGENKLFGLAHTFLDDTDGSGSTVEKILPYVRYLLNIDEDGDGLPDLVTTEVVYVSEVWNRGDLQNIASQLEYILTHNTAGQDVGFDGPNLLDELLERTDSLSSGADMLVDPITIGSTTTTPLDMALNLLDSFYEDGYGSNVARRNDDRNSMHRELEGVIDDLCSAVGRNDPLCGQMREISETAGAFIDTEIIFTILPLAYGFHQVVDLDDMCRTVYGHRLQDLSSNDILALMDFGNELSAQTRFLNEILFDENMLERNLELVPVFIDTDAGVLSPEGEDAIALAQFAIGPWSEGGPEVVPILVPIDVLFDVLDPEDELADLDALIGVISPLLTDDSSHLSLDNLQALGEVFQANFVEPADQEPIDWMEQTKEVLDNEELWMSALHLGADEEMATLLSPAPEVHGAPWFLYDLIERGVVARLLSFSAGLLDMLDGLDDSTEGS